MSNFAGWIAFYNRRQFSITKYEANSIYEAKKLAIAHFRPPKSKLGLLAIEPAYVEENEIEEKDS